MRKFYEVTSILVHDMKVVVLETELWATINTKTIYISRLDSLLLGSDLSICVESTEAMSVDFLVKLGHVFAGPKRDVSKL